MTDAVSIRLTPTQMSLICPGLEFLVRAHADWRNKKTPRYSYPFQIYPLPYGFDRGTFDEYMMRSIIALRRKLLPKARRGGRVQMNAIEVRAAMFAIRTNYGHHRAAKRIVRKWSRETRERMGLGDHETKLLRRRSKRVIHSMERHLKRANRRLFPGIPRDAYDALMDVWQMHLRWMRFHLAYFKPWPSSTFRPKTQRQRILNTLTDMAEKGLRNEGYQPPDSSVLRHALRLYVRSSVRGREGWNSVHDLLSHPNYFTNKWFLAMWVISRVTKRGIELKRLDEE